MSYQSILRLLTRSVLLLSFTLTAARGQSIYVSLDDHSIVTVPSGGSNSSVFATFPDGDPIGLAFDATGNLYASDGTLNTIVRLTPGGNSSVFASDLSNPAGLAFDTSGNLFVANPGDINDHPNSILKFAPNGTFTVVANLTDGISQPEGLAFDSHGNLFVANFGGNITKITPGGSISTFASDLGVGLIGLAIDHADNVYTDIFFQSKILKIAPGGSSSVFASGSGLSNPTGLAFDGSNLYVANSGGSNILVFASDGSGSVFASDLPSTPEFLTVYPPTPAAIPEPAEYAGCTGLAALALTAWRRRRA